MRPAFAPRLLSTRPRPLRLPLFPYTTLFRSPTDVAPDDHSVRAARWRGRGDVRRPGLSRTVPEEHTSRGHQPDPGSEVRRCLGYRTSAEHTSELQPHFQLLRRILAEKDEARLRSPSTLHAPPPPAPSALSLHDALPISHRRSSR